MKITFARAAGGLVLSAMTLAATATSLPARADNLSANDIVRSLSVSKKPRTRSLGKQDSGAPAYSAEEKELIKSMPTRGLKIEMKQEIGKIIDTYKPPRLDIEIQFDFNSDAITAGSVPDLNALGTALIDPSLSGSRIILNGHTDAKGSNDYNLDLSERRAASVRQYLLEHFPIEDGRLIAIGFGEERLKNAYDPEAAENRRVEIVNMGS